MTSAFKSRQSKPPATLPANPPVVLTIAGSDSSGGAGIQADLKTFAAFGVYGASVITALTAQNTTGVQAVEPVAPDFVAAQLRSVLDDLNVSAIKTGMLANAAIVSTVADILYENFGVSASSAGRQLSIPLIVDPVMVATSGDALLQRDAIEILKSKLIPMATLLTPNVPEAAALLGSSEAATKQDYKNQLRDLHRLGAAAVLLKGGHDLGQTSVATSAGAGKNEERSDQPQAGRHQRMAVDHFYDGQTFSRFEKPWVETRNNHGTGCTLAAAIAASLALDQGLNEAIIVAKTYVWGALDAAKGQQIGKGAGPLQHFCSPPFQTKALE